MNLLAGWANFYVIVGSSAGALIGLQFVVLTLIADGLRSAEEAQIGSAFATPTIVYFSAALLLAGLVCAPWDGIGTVAVLWGILGFIGVVYSVRIAWSLRKQGLYKLQLEDVLFHIVLPVTAYAMLVVSACMTNWHASEALFVVAAAALLLLFIGIHNAWDNVTYHVFIRRQRQRDGGSGS